MSAYAFSWPTHDAREHGGLQDLVARIEQDHGSIDILVNVLDGTAPASRAALGLSRRVMKGMQALGSGCIVNVSALEVDVTEGLSREQRGGGEAVETLSGALRAESAAYGVDVVSVRTAPAPSWMAGTAGELSARAAARSIVRAALEVRPRARYSVGVAAHLLPMLSRWLPLRISSVGSAAKCGA